MNFHSDMAKTTCVNIKQGICCTNDGDELFREDIEGSVELWDVFVEWCKTAKHLDGRIGIAPF